MKTFANLTLAALMGVGAVALVSTSASAAVVCNHDGDCWHAQHGDYPDHPRFGLIIHPDDWRWKDNEKYHWHEHAGRGYWEGDTWKTF